MKQLIQFIFPTVKAIVGVIVLLIGLGWTAVMTQKLLAYSEAQAAIAPVVTRMDGIDKRQDDLVKAMDSRMNAMDDKLNILIDRN